MLNCLTANVAAIVDKKLVLSKETNNDLGYGWLKTNYAGSGPLKIREWRANEILALERNDNYYGEKSKLPRVIYRHVKEAATQRLLLEKGDVDIARNLTPQDLAAVASNKDIRTTSTPKGTVYYFSLNQKNPTLAKPEVREAMKWLVDYAAIGDTLIKNIGVVHQNFLPVGLLGASTENPYKLDVEKAKALLAKAGVPNGFKVTMDVRTVQPVQGIAEAIQQTAKRAGIEIEIIPGDGKQTLTKYRARSTTSTSASGAPTTGIRTPTPTPSPAIPTMPTTRSRSRSPGATRGRFRSSRRRPTPPCSSATPPSARRCTRRSRRNSGARARS